jgi:hypothetical protein
MNGHSTCITTLARLQAEIHAKDSKQQTALHLARALFCRCQDSCSRIAFPVTILRNLSQLVNILRQYSSPYF